MFHSMTSEVGALPPHPRTSGHQGWFVRKALARWAENCRGLTNRDGHTRLMGREIPFLGLSPRVFLHQSNLDRTRKGSARRRVAFALRWKNQIGSGSRSSINSIESLMSANSAVTVLRSPSNPSAVCCRP